MTDRQRRIGIGAVLAALFAGTALVGSADAVTPLGCGSVIKANTTLAADIGPCNQGGLIIGADNVTLNLGGKTVFGKTRGGDGAGIRIEGRSNVTLTNGIVRAFDTGVVILGGGSNTVQGVSVRNNVGVLKSGKQQLGDGVAIQSSNNNTITGNTITGNGPFGGITILGDTSDPTLGSSGNSIVNNQVVDNDVDYGDFGPNQNDGIRIEGPNATNNIVQGHAVRGNGLDGIAVFADQATGLKNTGNQILGNTVEGNGFHQWTHRKGTGIILFGAPANPAVGGADSTTVSGNQVHGNAANGISVAAKSNTISANNATGNAVFPGVTNVFDLVDTNTAPACDNNTWTGNTFSTANQVCIS